MSYLNTKRSSVAGWVRWIYQVEDLLGFSIVNGDQDVDGYDMGHAFVAWEKGMSAEGYADYVRQTRARLGLAQLTA